MWSGCSGLHHHTEAATHGCSNALLGSRVFRSSSAARCGTHFVPQGAVHPSDEGSTGAVDVDWDLEAIAAFFGSQP